jgi:uncharacterized membrane protein (DUF373 family)
MGGSADHREAGARQRALDRGMQAAETVVYVLIAVVLAAGAGLLLADAAYRLLSTIDDGIDHAAQEALDVLLLTFIFVELLGAVRTTLREHRLVAEPFLVVGIIAAIKEIIVLSVTEEPGTGERFTDAMIEIGVLGGLALLLALAAWLLRVKEREPSESGA